MKATKILIVDTGKGVYNQLNAQPNLKVEHIQPDKDDKIYDIAEQIAGKITGELPEAIMINLEAGYENTPRSELKGTELIYWLRLKHKYTGSIITYGFLAPEQILRLKPEYVVIHAPGNRHLRVPFDINELKGALKPANLEADKLLDIYRPYAEKLVNLHKARHERANWWAIKVMWDIDNIRKAKTEPYPKYIQEKLKELNNFLIGEIFQNKNFQTLEREIRSVQNKNDILNDKIKKLEKEIIEIDKKIKQINYGRSRNKQQKSRKKTKNKSQNPNKNNNDALKKLEQNKNKLIIEKDKLKTELSQSFYPDYIIKHINKQEVIIKDNVLIIDDMIDDGWKELYNKIFPDIQFYYVNFDFQGDSTKEKINKLKSAIYTKITTIHDFSFIVLDLRLFKEDNQYIWDLSGFEILKFLKNEFPEYPVLITSASNKIWNLNQAITLGADGYWVKEGIDNQFDVYESIRNYHELIDNFKFLTGKEFKILNKIRELRKKINITKNKFWWEEHTWKNKYLCSDVFEPKNANNIIPTPQILKNTHVQKEDIIEIIKYAEKLYREYIKALSFNLSKAHPYMYNLLMYFMGLILEKIHPHYHDGKKITFTSYQIMRSRGDFTAADIYIGRNKAIHKKIFTNDEFKRFIEKLIKYLTTEIQENKDFINQQIAIKAEYEKRKNT